ncbi:copper amine oxidase N-terminal domain-containing protein [Paenibacillus lautus]|uniref:copper amine oxidase N-terminal domain-containing protein n=1 Tax=Paenibacillus lautus TaxID=1401 RepID=UPI003D298C96
MSRKRGIVCFLSIFILLTISFTEAADAKDVKVNEVLVESGPDKELSNLNDPVIISNGRVLLPIREVGDLLNLKVYWDQSSKTASLYGVNKEIKLTIGSKTACVNNKQTSLDVAAKVINGKTYLPLKFVAKATGESVSWNSYSKNLTMSRSYAMGSDKELTYWIHHETGVLSKAETRQPGVKIGRIDNTELSILKKFDVSKLSDSSSYIAYNQISGPSATVKVSGQALIVNDKIVDQGDFLVMGYYLVTNIQKAKDQVLITDGKNARFLDQQGKIQSSFNLTEIMGKDEVYMIEEYNNDFMILREYSSQHLIVYDFKAKEAIYVHEVIELPAFEKDYLIQAGLDRNNEMEYDHIVLFDKVDSRGDLLFKYKSKKNDKINTYKLAL